MQMGRFTASCLPNFFPHPDACKPAMRPFHSLCYRKMPRKNPRRNISRIETSGATGKSYGGWEVRMQRRGKRHEKFFSDNAYGGKRNALSAAKDFRDELEDKLKGYSVKELSKRPSTRNRSGVVGVRLHHQKDIRGEYIYYYWYWIAQWTDGHGKRKTRSFSCHTYGDDEAYRLACQARKEGVENANR